MVKFYLILAKTPAGGIGYKGDLPWQLKNELAYFSRMTKDVTKNYFKNAVVMGKKTWDALPSRWKPLPDRVNIVLSRSGLNLGNKATVCKSLTDVSKFVDADGNIETVWIIGGAQVYESAIKEGFCDRLYMTDILKDFPCDTFVNINVDKGFREIFSDHRVPNKMQEEEGVKYKFRVYEKYDNV